MHIHCASLGQGQDHAEGPVQIKERIKRRANLSLHTVVPYLSTGTARHGRLLRQWPARCLSRAEYIPKAGAVDTPRREIDRRGVPAARSIAASRLYSEPSGVECSLAGPDCLCLLLLLLHLGALLQWSNSTALPHCRGLLHAVPPPTLTRRESSKMLRTNIS